jgi:phytoene synthase
MSKGAQVVTKIRDWERPLLSLAQQAWQADSVLPAVEVADSDSLALAYDYCEEITAIHSRSFYSASGFLPTLKRRSVRALYAFCRTTDDIVDNALGGRGSADLLRAELDTWHERSMTHIPPANDPIVAAWTDTRLRYRIPQCYAEQLFEGVASDIEFRPFQTFADLTTYCYGVAATVGLMCIHVIGFSGVEALPYALKLGVALQLTNILRDVGEDWKAGRLYLPREDLVRYSLQERDIEAGIVDDRWRRFMQFQIARTRQLYEEAWPGIALLHADGRFAIGAAAELYRAILADIEAHDYDVFSRRAYVNRWRKLKRLPAIWWRSKTMRGPRQNGFNSPH